MKCSRWNEPRTLLLTTWAECDCAVSKYPELAEGRFFWLAPGIHTPPEGGYYLTKFGHWELYVGTTLMLRNVRHLFALPGPQPTHVPIDVPVLDRPPFGAWGDRFYVWEPKVGLTYHEYKRDSEIRWHGSRFSCSVREYREHFLAMDAQHWDASGTTRQAGLAWLDEMERVCNN